MSDTRYFALRDEHGTDHEENLQPIVEVGLSIPNPLAAALGHDVKDKVVIVQHDELTDELPARVIPGTRLIETNDFIVAESLLACGQYEEVGAPTKATIEKAHKETKAHVEALKTRDALVAKGELEPPDAADHDANPENAPQGEEA
jgi:hypothetical protein